MGFIIGLFQKYSEFIMIDSLEIYKKMMLSKNYLINTKFPCLLNGIIYPTKNITNK